MGCGPKGGRAAFHDEYSSPIMGTPPPMTTTTEMGASLRPIAAQSATLPPEYSSLTGTPPPAYTSRAPTPPPDIAAAPPAGVQATAQTVPPAQEPDRVVTSPQPTRQPP